MKKSIILTAIMLIGLSHVTANTLTGTIKTDTDAPVADAVVSDGFSVVRTNNNGQYTMDWNPQAHFVFVSVPSGYDIPLDTTGTPHIWQQVDQTASTHKHDFILHQQTDGGKADSSHVLLVIGDPQVYDNYCLWRFRNETIKDIQQLKASYPQGTKFIGLIVGDVVWDTYDFFPSQKTSLEQLGFPTFIAIGNHDHNRNGAQQSTQALQDSVAGMLFESYFGPTYYSFNVGSVHYVVLDNVYYKGYKGGDKSYTCELSDKQKAWVKKDIAQLAEGTQVVYAMHINAENMFATTDSLRALAAPLHPMNYIMSGHTHTNTVKSWGNNMIEHNVAACQGSYWCSDWCADGTPNGYKVFETNQHGIVNWYYKGTGHNQDLRIRTFPKNSINAGNSKFTSVLANIWDWDDSCSVQILVDGMPKDMKQFSGTDPDIYDLMLDDGDTRPNYPGSEGGTDASKNPGSKKTNHMFYYTPKSSEKNANFEVVFTDRFGKVTKEPVLKHMMVAAFSQTDEGWEYQQDFNSLPSYPNYMTTSNPKISRGTWVAGHTPQGWYGVADTIGYNYLRINNGSQSVGWLYSYGSGDPMQAHLNSEERALGSITTNTKQPHISYGVLLENNTGATITSLDINYTGEVWRVGTSAQTTDKLTFSYAILTDAEAQGIRDRQKWISQINTTSVEQLSFSTPSTLTAKQTSTTRSALDGNNPCNQTQVAGQVNMTWEPGTVILLRWDDQCTTDNEDQALAIDDLTIKATHATELSETNQENQQPTMNRPYWYKGQVWIDTEKATFNLTGQTY